jgi:hypothetical protein
MAGITIFPVHDMDLVVHGTEFMDANLPHRHKTRRMQ